MARRVLLITYTFPPTGGAGVQRVAKFVKYLHEFGWQPTVLTVANPSVPLQDPSLVRDVPPETVVRRARTLEPSYALKAAVIENGKKPGRAGLLARIKGSLRRLSTFVLQPDAQVLWMPGAIREGKRILAETPHQAIMATAPPFSSLLIGAALQRASGLPLLLDYRDEWDLSSAYWENKRLDPLSLRWQRHLQHKAVRAASIVLGTTRHSARALEKVCTMARSHAQVSWIYNGYDAEDFTGPPPESKSAKFRLAYVGTLWSLTSPLGLVNGIRHLAKEHPQLAAQLQVIVAGRRTPTEQEILNQLKSLPCELVEHPYLSHPEALALMRTAEANCALLADLPGAGRVVPAKIFEYMAAQRPILTIAPPGELWDLLRDYPAAMTYSPGDSAAIAQGLARAIGSHLSEGGTERLKFDAGRYERRAQASQLAGFLDMLAGPDLKQANLPDEALALA